MDQSAALDEAIDPLIVAETWKNEGRNVAIATVVETWGSAPRPVGSHLVIDAEGNFQGSVSGGCVEGAVVAEAIDILESGKPRLIAVRRCDRARRSRREWVVLPPSQPRRTGSIDIRQLTQGMTQWMLTRNREIECSDLSQEVP